MLSEGCTAECRISPTSKFDHNVARILFILHSIIEKFACVLPRTRPTCSYIYNGARIHYIPES